MRTNLLLFITLLLLTACSRPAAPVRHALPPDCAIYDLRQARCIEATELVRRLQPYPVLFIGDHHNSAALHRSVADLLTLLGKRRSVHLANEWFVPEDNTLLASYVSGTYEGNFTEDVGWKGKAGYPFSSYAPIYEAVRGHGGALYGINMTRQMKKAVSDGNRSAFIDALDLNLTAHRQLLAPFFRHCHSKNGGESDAACAARMYRVQVAWDTHMAEKAAALQKALGSEDLLAVFAGSFHLAYGLGINARFARRSATPFVTLLPMPAGASRLDPGYADYVLFYDAPTAP